MRSCFRHGAKSSPMPVGDLIMGGGPNAQCLNDMVQQLLSLNRLVQYGLSTIGLGGPHHIAIVLPGQQNDGHPRRRFLRHF